MRKTWVGIMFVFFILLFVSYSLYVNTIDTKYAIEFSKVFKTYNMRIIDCFFTDETVIICNGKSEVYKELRNNVMRACNEKRFVIEDSYGSDSKKFSKSIQYVTVYLYGKLDNESINGQTMKMRIERTGLFDFRVTSLECNSQLFEHLFYALE